MPCPYDIILGRDTALPSPLYYSGAAGIDITFRGRARVIWVPRLEPGNQLKQSTVNS